MWDARCLLVPPPAPSPPRLRWGSAPEYAFLALERRLTGLLGKQFCQRR
jgi:hypothetical protein